MKCIAFVLFLTEYKDSFNLDLYITGFLVIKYKKASQLEKKNPTS